jgi:hypothetical protein
VKAFKSETIIKLKGTIAIPPSTLHKLDRYLRDKETQGEL